MLVRPLQLRPFRESRAPSSSSRAFRLQTRAAPPRNQTACTPGGEVGSSRVETIRCGKGRGGSAGGWECASGRSLHQNPRQLAVYSTALIGQLWTLVSASEGRGKHQRVRRTISSHLRCPPDTLRRRTPRAETRERWASRRTSLLPLRPIRTRARCSLKTPSSNPATHESQCGALYSKGPQDPRLLVLYHPRHHRPVRPRPADIPGYYRPASGALTPPSGPP
ncbi:hypothetical protein B0H12DRAFT_1162564 [Mycena haematopus]|nr:hypothetical protein B0H12DRAFT_1162564 [Mycena haematopus]